jgi:starch synthase
MIKVLFPVWEVEPFIKVGGLGVVARSLPTALKNLGIDIALVLPYYKAINFHHKRKTLLGTVFVPYAKKMIKVKVWRITFINEEIPILLLQNTKYFDKPGPETFALFAGAVIAMLKAKILGEWVPDLIHCNDNHCGLIPLLLKVEKIQIKTLLTIHCVSHQRKSPAQQATDLGIPLEKLSLTMWEPRAKQLNFLLEGILHADWVNTVSPTYLNEIQTEEMGAGLDDVIRKYKSKIVAILNGLDYELCNPAKSKSLAVRYTAEGVIEAKRANKALLQEKFGLPVQRDVTMIGFVGRFDVRQKGIDVLHRMLWREQFENCQFVIMGHGEEAWEDSFASLAVFLPKSVAVQTKYDDDLANILYAGSDFVLIPSHFEPCCLIQMHSMRYGAIPIARATGGLSDTIVDKENGMLYESPTARALKVAIERAIELKRKSPQTHHRMMIQAMNTNFSWDRSAVEYAELYKKILSSR